MKRMLLLVFLVVWGVSGGLYCVAQEAGPEDFGKMWTFENPPVDFFSSTYDFEADERWFEEVRLASLRFASWCSGSFVSPNGLILTNHHCSRGVSLQAQREGEDFTRDGFYASTMEDERRVFGLFVEQLLKVADISVEVEALVSTGSSRDEAIKSCENKYTGAQDWDGLRLQVVEYYNGAKIALHGYKRYEDIRLVMVPEVQAGFFGGDDDNFTYPRYSLDLTFWRAYDETGKPVRSSDHFFPFNPNGPSENEPVFVIGNPARTERYKTVAQLEFDRDYIIPMILEFLSKRYYSIKEKYQKTHEIQYLNQLFGLGNSMKVYDGILKGLKDPELFGRKTAMEEYLRKQAKNDSLWEGIRSDMEALKPHAWARQLLGPSPFRGPSFQLMHAFGKYERQIREGAPATELAITREEIMELGTRIGGVDDKELLTETLEQVEKYLPAGHPVLKDLLGKKEIGAWVDFLFEKSEVYQPQLLQSMLELDGNRFLKKKDPMLRLSRAMIGAYTKASKEFSSRQEGLTQRQRAISSLTYQIFGETLPPDATFTPRISDGLVKGYGYNGTVAPFQTTFFGMYDRHYSHEGNEAWDLPEKWKDPNPALLPVPLNFVSTNDIIGGNSGSPIINRNKELVGLIFDGNIESLPGNFIYDDTTCRAVSVHAGGMLAALKYIYGAERIYMELLGRR